MYERPAACAARDHVSLAYGVSSRGGGSSTSASGTGASGSEPKPRCSAIPAAGTGSSSSKPHPQCLRRRSTVTGHSVLPTRHPRPRPLEDGSGGEPLARGGVRAARGPREAADEAIAALEDRGSPAHDGLAARLAGYEAGDGRLELELQPMRWSLRLVREDASASLAALCVTRAADGRWLAGRRAAWVASWAGRWALGAGGSVEVGEDPVETLTRELDEEWSVAPERLSVEALVSLPEPAGDAGRPRVAARGRRGHRRRRARRARLVARRSRRLAGGRRPVAAPDGGDPGMSKILNRDVLRYTSYSLSVVYAVLLWAAITGRQDIVGVLGWVHGIGWIVMSLLCLEAVRRRVIPFWLGVMVAVVGGVGPFAGSIGFYLEDRKIRHQGRAPRPAAEKVS